MIRSNPIRKSARGESCDIASPVCNGDSNTVVWCHSPFGEHGKGYGLKSHDLFGCYGCSNCHYWLDTDSKRLGVPHEERLLTFYRAMGRSLQKLVAKGLVKVPA